MIQGTASGVGKTILTLALCRIFKQDAYTVAPFKAQNMTANTRLTGSGDEIAISQWLQALAAGVEPCVDMNPVILKPGAQKGTQVILYGRPYDMIDARNYKEVKAKLAAEIMEAYSRLCSKYDVLVIEGAGSPVELNLNKNDIVNMGMAKKANAPVLLVSDIDRGGVFASMYGTLALMDEAERNHVKAVVVNRFKGNPAQFTDGVKILEDITQKPVAGVLPHIKIELPEEDDMFEAVDIIEGSTDFERQIDDIAYNIRRNLDMSLIYNILDKGFNLCQGA